MADDGSHGPSRRLECLPAEPEPSGGMHPYPSRWIRLSRIERAMNLPWLIKCSQESW